MGARVRRPRELPGMLEAAWHELVAPRRRLLDRRGDRIGIVRIGAERDVAARLVERRVRGGDDWDGARHRFDDRHPEALKPGRIDEDARAPVLAGALLAAGIAEPGDVLAARLDAAPARRTDDAQLAAADRIDRALEVLSRLERADGEHVVALRARPFAREDRIDARIGDVDPPSRDAERTGDVIAGELRVDD